MNEIQLRLTIRDIELLKDIYANQFLSFYQIHEKHFHENKRPTVYNRLSKLIRGSILEATNVQLMCHHRRNELIGVIYRLTKEGSKKLQEFSMTYDIQFNSVPVNMSCLYHDLLLTDVLRILKRRWPELQMLNSKVHNQGFPFKERIPDGVLLNPRDKNKIALELELTAKSETRYRDIILSYRTSHDFEKVIYVVKDRSIQKKLGGLITGFNGRYVLGDNTDKFEFILLEDLIKPTMEVKYELQA